MSWRPQRESFKQKNNDRKNDSDSKEERIATSDQIDPKEKQAKTTKTNKQETHSLNCHKETQTEQEEDKETEISAGNDQQETERDTKNTKRHKMTQRNLILQKNKNMPKTPKNSQNGGKQAQNSQKCSKKMQKSQKIRKRSKTAQCHVDVGGASRQVGHMWWGTERVHLSFLRPPPEGSTLRTPASVRAFWRLFRDRSSFDPRWCFLALFGYLCFFLCSFIFVCCFLAVFGAFPVILWSFYGRQFLFCGCLFNHRLCLCDAGFCVWWCSVVLFVVILCLLLLFCVFVIISLFLVVVYFFWSDITFVKMPRPLRKYDRPTQHQWSTVMLWCWVWCCVILIVCNIKVTAEWMNVWYQCERLQLLLASLTLTLWPGV